MRDTPPPLAVTPRAQTVWTWYVVYCVLMALLFLAAAGMGVVVLVMDPAELDMPKSEAELGGTTLLAMGLVLTVPFAAAPFLPRRPWVWVCGVVLIALGLTSPCCWPAAIPLLIFWLKDDVKARFGYV